MKRLNVSNFGAHKSNMNLFDTFMDRTLDSIGVYFFTSVGVIVAHESVVEIDENSFKLQKDNVLFPFIGLFYTKKQ